MVRRSGFAVTLVVALAIGQVRRAAWAAVHAPVMNQMADLARHYENAVVVPIVELDHLAKPTIANLVQQGLDETAMRTASTLPMIWCPPADPLSKRSKLTAVREEPRSTVTKEFWRT